MLFRNAGLFGSDLLQIGQILIITVSLKIIHAWFVSHHTTKCTHVHAWWHSTHSWHASHTTHSWHASHTSHSGHPSHASHASHAASEASHVLHHLFKVSSLHPFLACLP